jgi:predicted MFS family arabinose efflux permease
MSGLASGFWPLLASRVVMGAVEGPFLPICLAIVAATSPASRRGVNTGMVQNLFGSVLGAAVAPLLSVAIATAFGWRVSFFTAALPGLILALFVWLTIREPAKPLAGDAAPKDETLGILDMLRRRNVALCGAIACLAVGSALLVSIFLPVYLVSVRHYSPHAMSTTMAILGLTPPIGGVIVPWLSDRFGRRPPMIVFTALMALTPLATLLFHGPAAVLTALLFVGWLGIGTFPLFMAVVPAETLAFRSTAAAMGLVVAIGEIFGGVLAPSAAGSIADSFGLAAPMIIATAMSLVAGLVSMALIETNPAILAKAEPAPAAS